MTRTQQYIARARAVIDIELEAIEQLKQRIDEDFAAACELMFQCKGRIVVTGMGKSGHVGSKIAATLASTGSPAFFVHPGEASHGDLGMITRDDVVLALSNSGETGEITALLPVIKRLNVPLISMTGRPESTLAQFANVNINTGVEKEACPLNLAPTASTTTALVMGDALAIALLDAKGFGADDFALSHPGGSLGRKLLLKVEDVMHKQHEVPRVHSSTVLKDALIEMTEKRLGMTTIVDDDNRVIGIFTDGDLRRTLERSQDFLTSPIEQLMTSSCQTIMPHFLAAEAVQIMEDKSINALVVVDHESRAVGALNMHDLLKAGVV